MNRNKRTGTILLAIVLALGVSLPWGIGGVFAESAEQVGEYLTSLFETEEAEETEEAKVMAAADQDKYIYFDLAAGNVNIGKTTYTGYVFVNGTSTKVTGTHTADNKYYVYQSNPNADQSSPAHPKNTGYASTDDRKNCRIPKYSRVQTSATGKKTPWTDYVTNNTDVKTVSRNWETAAADSGRTATKNNITFADASDYTADVTIDNIWSTFQKPSATRSEGGITAHLKGKDNTKIQLRLKGDNRVGNVHYGAERNDGTRIGNQIIFSNGEDADQTPGSITVADFPDNFKGNHWCSAIGGDDNSCDRSDGIVINSGVIYAGTTPEDNCTAIGGGGNQYGRVTINGGTVTAVVSSTGTAIGGGIGYGDAGGDTDIRITNGTIYAYNLGIEYGKGDNFIKFVPAAAIGGGGSRDKNGNKHTAVTIEGGTVYAQSMGGTAIGGGCSASTSGGPADINITGGTVIAKSTNGKYGTTDIPAGVSIGGGTGKTAGGSVILNVSGGILRTGSIGGGLATQEGAKVGSANVKVTGGDITGQVVMAGGGTNPCTFDMSGGEIHDTNLIDGNKVEAKLKDPQPDVPIKYARDDGGAVFMNDPKGVTNITGGTIEGCTARNGGAIWMNGGTFTLSGTGTISENTAKVVEEGITTGLGGAICMEGGTANINGGTISGNTADNNGGGVYLPGGDFTLDGGTISGNKADNNGGGIYLSKAPTLNKGMIASNTAKKDGGGMYISDCVVELSPADRVDITGNSAQNGAGIYIHDSNPDNSGGSGSPEKAIDAVSNATEIPKDAVGLHVVSSESANAFLSFTNNIAETNGGAVCVDGGRFILESDQIEVKGNKATNGGGVAAFGGNFTMFKGSIGEEGENGGNKATNGGGGGVYVSGGDVWLKGGSVKYNEAENGGGICVQDGKVYMYDGAVDQNKANQKGGGIYLSSTTDTPPLVDILSGSISSNKATDSGGGIAVVSEKNEIKVTVGVNCTHDMKDDGTFEPFEYPMDCGDAHEDGVHVGNTHSSCPVVENNTTEQKGGGFFLDSPASRITIYCLQEDGNTAKEDPNSNCMDVEGGHLQIGDKAFDIHEEGHPLSGAKGNTTMQGSIMVRGGQVDVYGEMENPKFIDDVKVDVKNSADHYVDHRIIKTGETEYKVHYYENFKNDDGTTTGLYIARQYPDKDHADVTDNTKYDFTVMASIFSRPGYKIVGWNTKPDDSGDKYEVNQTYNLEELAQDGKIGATITTSGGQQHKDDYLLVLYAIWERNGYVLKFDPNVGEGETYTGTMKNQQVTMGLLDGSQKINENQFKRPGYKFTGWTLTPAPTVTDTVYEDGHAIEEDFTTEDGATVTLYANWALCDHVDFLTYTANGNILTQSCSNCGGHTATATVSAVNCTFDGEKHLATANFSANWLGDKPEISYGMEDSKWDGDGIDEAWKNDPNPQPLHAGNYTAKITGENQTDDHTIVIAQVEYTISPIKWETPDVPQILFKVSDDQKSIIEISSPDDANIKYKITKLENNTDPAVEGDVEGYPDWQKNKQFSNIPFGFYYYFYAKRCADRDHLESEPSRSEAYLADGGNIVYIKNDTGIKVEPNIGDGIFQYTVSAADGYHLRGYRDNLDQAIIDSHAIDDAPDGQAHNDDGITIRKTASDETYIYEVAFDTNKVAYWQLTLEFSGAVKDASVTHKVTDGQVFVDFNDKENTSISCDSAFTAQFTVSDYIPDEYVKQELSFSDALPAGTTVIMKVDGKYWYYKLDAVAGSDIKLISLTEFTAMGGDKTENFSFDDDSGTAKTFTYQFIVDFSQTTENRITNSLGLSLKLTASIKHNAPTIPISGETHISLGMEKEAVFELTPPTNPEKSATFTCTYTPSKGAASIWNGRNTALVLTAAAVPTAPETGSEAVTEASPETVSETGSETSPETDSETVTGTDSETAPETVPPDLTLTAVIDGNTTLYTMNSKRQFIIPLGEVGTKEIKITLNSCLFGWPQDELAFTAEWYVSQSSADKSPLNGYLAASCGVVTFNCPKDALPSVLFDNSDSSKHRCEAGGRLSVPVEYKGIPAEGTITAYLQSKNSGQYVDTGARVSILDSADTSPGGAGTDPDGAGTGPGDTDTDPSGAGMTPGDTGASPDGADTRSDKTKVEFSMGQMAEGSYRILVIVQESGANILQVPYYFVIA